MPGQDTTDPTAGVTQWSLGTTGDWELDLSLLQEVLTTVPSPQPLCPFII